MARGVGKCAACNAREVRGHMFAFCITISIHICDLFNTGATNSCGITILVKMKKSTKRTASLEKLALPSSIQPIVMVSNLIIMNKTMRPS